ncbi:MAG: hypothetical protein MRERV_5c073 [Mycoplasmataceae bacterium RV_VA103A]|nr:MAG: hypothetical protein MRERV_5c073 [Mycoplasmataceae bacterium RV_VA103A]
MDKETKAAIAEAKTEPTSEKMAQAEEKICQKRFLEAKIKLI